MEWEYEYWLACIRPLGDKKKMLLREYLGDGKVIYNIEETKLRSLGFLNEKDIHTIKAARKNRNILAEYEESLHLGIRFIPYFQEEYPEKLKKIPSPPYAIYLKGRLPAEHLKSVAIVGARRCTTYGEQMALEFGSRLARAGVQIISGMARGIDGAGQRGALNADGMTYAVLGCGVDICYPKEHIGLYMDVLKQGGIISEQPPKEQPLPAYFPARNRIISGLSDVVLVIEAKEKSGSLITADMALEQGKDVYAMPGPITSELSKGCNGLIKQGAGILLSAEDFMIEMNLMPGALGKNSDKNKIMLESPENMVYSCLGLFPKSISQLTAETNLNTNELFEQLVTLELQGYIKEISKNYYVKIK